MSTEEWKEELDAARVQFASFIVKYALKVDISLVEFHAIEDGWRHDRWSVTITRGRAKETVVFKTGTGSRRKCDRGLWSARDRNGEMGYDLRRRRYYCEKGSRWYAVPPDLESVLDCLRSESQAMEVTFEDWASELGYSTDSIRARDTWEACRESGAKLVRLVGLDGLLELRSFEGL